MEKLQMYIDGKFTDAASGKWFDTYNPFTGKVWAQVAQGGEEDVDRAVKVAHRAFSEGPWPALTASQRGMLLHRLGDLIVRDARKLAELEVRDNGKLIAEMQGQVNYLSQWYYYFGGLADKIQGAVIPLDKKGYFNFTRYEPLGVVAAITAWNSPLLLLAWKLAPALAAGSVVM
jgi:(Z)-2-((N-methylformamido)methylene)-5-hydroxybutyrolactone dehydrogenase